MSRILAAPALPVSPVIRPRQPISGRSTTPDYCDGFAARRPSVRPSTHAALQLISARSKQRKSFSRGFRMPIHQAVLRNMTVLQSFLSVAAADPGRADGMLSH